jgi:hypothetical protein
MVQVPINKVQLTKAQYNIKWAAKSNTTKKWVAKCMLIKHLLKPPKPHYNILKTMTTCNYSPMLSSEIDEMDSYFEFVYPIEFESFCLENDLKPPKIQSGNGKALSAMLQFPNKYWDRKACDAFVKKYDIPTKDSIQLFNKHSQWGIKTNSDEHVKGKLYIVQPFSLSNKHKMRKSFKFDGTQQEKESEISKIKSTIQEDYIHIPHDQWQLGHKNPGSTDNSTNNLILQPPIQAKYKDDYLFFDTLTKMPLPNKLERLLDKKEITLTQDQIEDYMKLFMKLKMNCDETPKTHEQINEQTTEKTNEQTNTSEKTNDNENL